MGLEEKLPSGILLSTVEKLAGYVRKGSLWPATFGLACCAIEMMATAGPRFDISRFGMERFSATPRQADLMIVAGRVSQKMAPVLRQVYDQMAEPKWVLAMGVCASSGGMFNNYAIVQGVDHVVPVDIYLPGCPPRPEMLLHAILKLHDKIQEMPLGVNREEAVREAEKAALAVTPTIELKGLLAVTDATPTPTRTPTANDQEVVGVRRGMFGPEGTGDTSGYGRLVREVAMPGSSPRPYGGYFDEVVDTLTAALGEEAFDGGDRAGGGVPRPADPGGAPRAPARGHAGAARRRRPAVRAVPRRQRRALPAGQRPRAARGVPADVDHPQPADPGGGHRTGRRPAHPVAVHASTRPPTGTSARPTTSSGSSSTAIPR